jgi:hypothetical protein
MNTDNSPALGGQSDDASPMIGSMQTRVFVSARGAYTAGNLHALTEMMHADKSFEFKVAVIRHAYDIVEPYELEATSSDIYVPELYDLAYRVGVWLQQPDPASLVSLRHTLELFDFHPISPNEHILFYLVRAVAAVKAGQVAEEAALAVSLRLNATHNTDILLLKSAVKQWHLDLAWAILADLASPVAPSFDSQNLQLLFTDLRRMYQQGNLPVLIYAMTPTQLDRFRYAVLSLVLWHIERITFPDGWQESAFAWLTEFSHWLIDSGQPTRTQVNRLQEALMQLAISDGFASQALSYAVQGFRAFSTSGQPPSNQAASGAESAARAVGYASAAGAAWGQSSVVDRLTREARSWQIEAAWAIINDDTPPRFDERPWHNRQSGGT